MPQPWEEPLSLAGPGNGCKLKTDRSSNKTSRRTMKGTFAEARLTGRKDLGAVSAVLSEDGLSLEVVVTGETIALRSEDIIGSDVNLSADKQGCVVSVFAYPLRGGSFLRKEKRERRCLELTLRKASVLQSIQDGHRWSHAVARLAHGLDLAPIASDRLSFSASKPLRRRRFIVYVNPMSGRGLGLRTFNDTVRPMLQEADVRIELVTTRSQGHAREHITTVDLDDVDCVLIVSGDGLLHEVINGLMSRPDSESAVLTPLSIIPSGSGNAMAASVLYSANEPYSVVSAVMGCLKGDPVPLDITHLSTPNASFYSFLSVAWGFVCDVDLESDVMRQIGELRFVISFFLRTYTLRRYKGRFAYLPASTEVKRDNDGSTTSPKNHTRPKHARKGSLVEDAGGRARCNGYSYPTSSRHETSNPDRSGSLAPSGVTRTEALDENWEVMEGDFTNVLPLASSHLASDFLWYSQSKLNDGLLHVLVGDGQVSRWALVKTLLLGPGEYDGHLRCIKVRAFRIEPQETGRMAIDGEAFELTDVHGTVLPGKARIMVPKTIKNTT